MLAHRRGHAGSRIADLETHELFVHRRGDCDPPARRHGVPRVCEQVGQYFADGKNFADNVRDGEAVSGDVNGRIAGLGWIFPRWLNEFNRQIP